MLPFKKLTCCVKYHNGAYKCISAQVMEVKLNRTLFMVKAIHPEIKIGCRTFQSLWLKIFASQETHSSSSMVVFNTLIWNISEKHAPTCSSSMTKMPHCQQRRIDGCCDLWCKYLKCIIGKCKDRKAFNKIDELKLECLKCWKDGIKKANDCKFHAVKVRQFECVTHSSREEEKIALVDKMVKFDELVHH